MKKSEWDEMKVSGFLGLIHRLVMLITFPIRKFWQITIFLFLLLLILLAIPLHKGIKLRDVWDWYMVKMPTHEFVAAKDKATIKVNNKIGDIKKTVKKIIPESPTDKTAQTSEGEKVQLVAWNVAEFKKAQYEPKTNKNTQEVVEKNNSFAQLKKETQLAAQLENEQQEQAAEQKYRDVYYEGKLDDYYIVTDNKDLEYLETPERFYDTVDVVGPNSLYIQDKFVFLYGIYSDADTYDTAAAQRFLQQITEGHKVHCDIVAYTAQTRAGTALCFVNGVLINKAMVENNLARNVALK